MRTKFLLVFLLLCVATVAQGQAADLGRKIYQQSSESVLLLYAESASGDLTALGSGFVVDEGRIVTNAHVANEGRIFLELGPARVATRIEKLDNANDLAVLRADVEITARPLPLARVAPAPGDLVFAIGNPEGLEKTISQGLVAGTRSFEGKELLQINAPISPGSSGGPVLNSSGEVVGVAASGLKEGQNLNFAIPVKYVRALLRSSSGGEGNVDATLQQVASLNETRSNETYSAEANSQYQRSTVRIRALLRQALGEAGTNPQKLINVSNVALYEDEDLSVEAAQRAVDSKPSQDSYRALAESLNAKAVWVGGGEQAKLFSKAEKAAWAALAASRSPTAKTFYDLGDILENERSYEQAEQFFRSALKGAQVLQGVDLQAKALRGLARCSYRLNKLKDSQEWFDKLVATGQGSWFDWDSQAQRLEESGKYKEAAVARELAANGGGDYTELCSAASDLYISSDADNALIEARQCIEKGTGLAGSDKTLCVAHQEIADMLNDRGVYTEALNHAREATALDSTSGFAFDVMGKALIGLHRPLEAVTAFQQAIRLSDGKYAYMHFHLGSAYFDLENWAFARDSFEKSAELDPKDAASAYNVALCLVRLNYFVDAAKWYEEYLRRKPNASDAAEIRATIRRLRGSD